MWRDPAALPSSSRWVRPSPQPHGAEIGAPDAPIWRVPDVGALPDDPRGTQIRLGRALVTQTYALIGPDAPRPADRYAGNNLACGDCHLEAGTKKFGLPLFGLYSLFPRYSARSGTEISIEDRINSCMTRSMNGARCRQIRHRCRRLSHM